MSDDRDNPRWHLWPFKGWRENDACAVISLVFWGVLIALTLWAFSGCYADHVAEPCDAGVYAGEASRAGSGEPSLLEEEVTTTQCAGPIVAGECYVDIHDVVSRGER